MIRTQPALTILLFTCICGQLFGQDTTIYRQANASMFWNNYTLIKASKSDNFGTFIQSSGSDDMQYWYGRGVFTETRHKIFLSFDTTNNHNRIQVTLGTKNSDTLYIRWLDWWGKDQGGFSIRFTDTTTNKSIFQVDEQTPFVKIPKSQLKDTKLSLYTFGSNRKIIDFEVDNHGNDINIYANDSLLSHAFAKTQEVLKRTKDGFVAVGMFTKHKKKKFVIVQE